MNDHVSEVDVAIVGAGSAGLSAAAEAKRLGLTFVLLEASHRIGGRAYTETEPLGLPFDLGCHWLHSASLNPYVPIADALGFEYDKDAFGRRRTYLGGRWATDAENEERFAFSDACQDAVREAAERGNDVSVADVTPREERWTPTFDFWMSVFTSADSDQVSAVDLCNYRDTDENWPLKDGYGALVAAHFAEVPVSLNAPAQRIDWSGPAVRIETPKGTVNARAVVVTVSTNVLAANAIRFEPALPDWKMEAVLSLPLGSHNRIGLRLDGDPFGPDERGGVTVHADTPETISFQIRPFDRDVVVGLVGGRFSSWLEKQGPDAMADYAIGKLKDIYGADIARHIVKTSATAWDGDPLILGAYSCALPGKAGARANLAEPIDGRLFFAGEATSLDFFSTCHGAYITGIDTVRQVAEALGRPAA